MMRCCRGGRIPSLADGLDPRSVPVLGPTAAWGRVVRVVDGDTVWVAVRERRRLVRLTVRLHGIDAPETRTRDAAEKVLGLQSKAELSSMVLDRLVGIEHKGLDKYGRCLAVLYLEGVDVSARMLERKLARPYLTK